MLLCGNAFVSVPMCHACGVWQVSSRPLVCGSMDGERDLTAESPMEDVKTAILGLLEILQVHRYTQAPNFHRFFFF